MRRTVNKWVKLTSNESPTENKIYKLKLSNLEMEETIIIIKKEDGWYFKSFDVYQSPSHIKLIATTLEEAQQDVKDLFEGYLQSEVDNAIIRRDCLLDLFNNVETLEEK